MKREKGEFLRLSPLKLETYTEGAEGKRIPDIVYAINIFLLLFLQAFSLLGFRFQKNLEERENGGMNREMTVEELRCEGENGERIENCQGEKIIDS